MKNHICNNTAIVGEHNNSLTQRDKSSRQKISQEITALNHSTSEPIELVDRYRVFYTTASESMFFSASNGTFSKVHHILVHRTCLDKCKRIEIIPCHII